MRSLADDRKFFTKVLVWWFGIDDDYLLKAEIQLKDEKIYRSVTFNEKIIEDLTECSYKMFKDLRSGDH